MTSGRGYIELCFCLQAVLYLLPTLCQLELFCVLHLTPWDNQCSSDTCIISTGSTANVCHLASLLRLYEAVNSDSFIKTKFSKPHRQLHVVSANWSPQLNDEHLSCYSAGSLYPEQPQVHRRSPSNLLSPNAGPSQQIGLIPAEPSPKTSDDNAGESSDKGDGRRKKLTKKQAQELEEIFQADHSGAPGMVAFSNRERKLDFFQTRWLVPANSVASWANSAKVRSQLGACPENITMKRESKFRCYDAQVSLSSGCTKLFRKLGVRTVFVLNSVNTVRYTCTDTSARLVKVSATLESLCNSISLPLKDALSRPQQHISQCPRTDLIESLQLTPFSGAFCRQESSHRPPVWRLPAANCDLVPESSGSGAKPRAASGLPNRAEVPQGGLRGEPDATKGGERPA